MEFLKRVFDITFMILNIQFTLCGFTFSFLELIIFFALGFILALIIGGIFS